MTVTVPPGVPSSDPPRRRAPANIWTHLVDVFDRCLDDDQRAQRLHGFTDPLMRTVLISAIVVGAVLLLIALAAVVLLVLGLTVSSAPAWATAAGAGGVAGSTLIGLVLRRGVRAAWRRIATP